MADQTRGGTGEDDAAGVVLVDDHSVFRSGLRHLLEDYGVNVVAEADCGEAAVRLVDELSPDVVLMDIDMPGIGGVEATRRISAAAPLVKVVILTISSDEQHIVDALMGGASGYLLKDAPLDQIVGGIEAAHRGEAWISPAVAARVLRHMRRVDGAPATKELVEALSERELAVLHLVAAGKDNASIARDLYLSEKTVKNHISSILRKLQVQNRVEAAIYAIRSGIA